LIRLSWVVFLHAALLSAESIAVEILTTQLQLSPLVIAGNSILIAGIALFSITVARDGRQAVSVFKSWKYLLPSSALVALGVFAWYDSVTNIGASKEGLLAGPLETVIILILARTILKEKLSSIKSKGALIALAGFFVTVMSAGNAELIITWGDIEAVISAASFAAGIVLITKMTKTHSALQITSSSLLISGIVLSGVLWLGGPEISGTDWAILAAFSILPLLAALTYVVGLARIGASMTSTIASFSILLTVVFQLILLALGFEVILPSLVPLAIVGGILGVFGIFLIHRKRGNELL
jgi:drug/metabolite transporter (DMT)-like permease